MLDKRCFKLFKVNDLTIHNQIPFELLNKTYFGKRPNQVALKIFNKLCSKLMIDDCKLNFTIYELTEYSKHKKYNYEGIRTKLLEPKIITVNNKTVSINYNNIIHKI
jgi:hypothetical protein